MLRLTRLRQERGWSKATLARAAGLGEGNYGAIENGRTKPYPVQLARIARALELDEADAETLMETVE